MLLEALVACAGVTLSAVTTALKVPIAGGTVFAEGDLDFRGTLGVAKVVALTERYCVVYQTLRHPPRVEITHGASGRDEPTSA